MGRSEQKAAALPLLTPCESPCTIGTGIGSRRHRTAIENVFSTHCRSSHKKCRLRLPLKNSSITLRTILVLYFLLCSFALALLLKRASITLSTILVLYLYSLCAALSRKSTTRAVLTILDGLSASLER